MILLLLYLVKFVTSPPIFAHYDEEHHAFIMERFRLSNAKWCVYWKRIPENSRVAIKVQQKQITESKCGRILTQHKRCFNPCKSCTCCYWLGPKMYVRQKLVMNNNMSNTQWPKQPLMYIMKMVGSSSVDHLRSYV